MIISLITLLAASPAAAQDCDEGVAIGLETPTGRSVDDIVNDASEHYRSTAFPGRYVGIGQHVVLEATYPTDPTDTGDSPSVCDPEECRWLINGWNETKGGFASCNAPGAPGKDAVGQDVCYFAPEDLEDCLSVEVLILLDCDDGGQGDWNSKPNTLLTVGPVATDEELNGSTAPEFPRCSVSGGGCISPQSTGEAWLLFPLLGLGGLVRRRQD
jgi:hypothetical protein